MNRHQLRGRINQAKGKAMSFAGKLFRNKSLSGKGHAKNAGGNLQAGYGDLKDETDKSV